MAHPSWVYSKQIKNRFEATLNLSQSVRMLYFDFFKSGITFKTFFFKSLYLRLAWVQLEPIWDFFRVTSLFVTMRGPYSLNLNQLEF